MNTRRFLRLTVMVGLTIALVLLVDWLLGWREIAARLQRLSVADIGIGLAALYASYMLRALRLYDFLRRQPVARRRFAVYLRLTVAHNVLNHLLPMRSGEASFPILLNRWFDMRVRDAIASLLLFRLLDLHSLLALGLIVAVAHYPASALALAVWLALPWWLFRHRKRLLSRVHQLPIRWLHADQFELQLSARQFARAWAWTIINWAVKLAVFALLLMLFIDIDWPAALLGGIGGELASTLPVQGLAGAGTYEAGVAAGLLPYAVASTEALAGATSLHIFVLGSALSSLLLLPFLGAGKPKP